ncbi:uncharacterized protein LOC114475878 isoform X6 [Gouania willdenowi]|uniref:uncharacterized protein LOC114475878 isoform X6 n=1 Tax=Gouania willdenowi TaxID=441366 RepID=UPI0010544D0B|nr:uncharacterized protein LOC114475878 isoform X6 [Gouania willdenowi]
MKILFGFTCPGDQRGSLSRPTKDALFQSTCQLCRESHKTQVWLYFLVLSLLSTSTCVTSTPEIADLQTCVKKLRDLIEKSDAMLYAPSLNEVEQHQMQFLSSRDIKLVLPAGWLPTSRMGRSVNDSNATFPPQIGTATCAVYWGSLRT